LVFCLEFQSELFIKNFFKDVVAALVNHSYFAFRNVKKMDGLQRRL
jgi:hypothetical protein